MFKKEMIADSVHIRAFENEYKVLKLIQEEKKASRDFLIQVAQLVLVNVLLPIITALLGYMFGTEKRGS